MVGLCRLCASLRKWDGLVAIKDDSNEICEKVSLCCQLDIKLTDPLPKSICRECIDNLNSFYKFRTKVNEAQETLLALYPLLPVEKEFSKQKCFQAKCSLTKELKKQEFAEIPSKEKFQNYILKQTDNCVGEISQTKKEITEVYMLDIISENEDSESSYETIEENIENLTADDADNYLNNLEISERSQSQISEVNSAHTDLILNEEILQSDESQKRNELPDSGIKFEVKYIKYQDEEDNHDKVDIPNIDSSSNYIKNFSPPPARIKLNSWKNYIFLCFVCGNTSSTFVDLKSHLAQEHNITDINDFQYKCYDCKKIIHRYNFFLNHVRSKHHSDLKLKCDVCDKSCQNFQELSHHRNANCAEATNHARIVSCNECFKSFRSVYGLQTHIKCQHNSPKIRIKYKCSQCYKEFQYKSCLKAHQQLHTGEKNVSCPYCDRLFYNKVGLAQHLYVHTNQKPYKCNICNKSYKTFSILDEHQKVHVAQKQFKCQFCEKSFCKKIQKLTHERRHTGEMPYACSNCDKRFRYSSALYAHIKIHTGCKPYACEYCPKTFADSSNRNKHVKRIHSKVENKEK